MDMDYEFCLPDQVPGMTLPNVVLFPQATIPLFIFESRYRKMLADVLDGDCLMLLATQDEDKARQCGEFEPCHKTATLGLVQSSQKNEDGTSSILLQGLVRVSVEDIPQEEPYRIFSIQPIFTEPGAEALSLEKQMGHLLSLIHQRSKLGNRISKEILRFLENIDDPDILTDFVSYTLIPSTEEKLRLLQTSNVQCRLNHLILLFRQEIQHLTLAEKLQGDLRNERIFLN